MVANELDQKIADVYKHIQTERKILEASELLRHATTNPDVLRRNETKIRETERSLSYFEATLRELEARKTRGEEGPQVPPKEFGTASASFDLPSETPKTKYTPLDLIKAGTPLTAAKISKMLHQLEFKLQVEMQYKKGIDKMAKLYQADGDKKSRMDAESKKVESEKKIQLLQASLKRYKNLHVVDDLGEEEEDESNVDGERKENLRSKPLSGTLSVTVLSARELDHVPLPTTRFSRSSKSSQLETIVSLKVEGTQLARSHPTRTDTWNEDFIITVDKANEVEIAIYDKAVGSELYQSQPIGLLWIRISDLVEALRRQKVNMGLDGQQGGWVTAGAMYGDGQPNSADFNAPLSFGAAPMGGPGAGGEGVTAWFVVEPIGAISLNLNFVKENVRKRQTDAPLGGLGGLGRQGAVKKRKGEVHEMNGHKFIQKQFYQLMLCAFCGDFLLNATGYQCEDCRYMCHKKCHEKVVTKCISKSNSGDDSEKINHRIPHRFEPLTNLSANWCCHCGYMLPLGRKNARKCTECDLTCHANCAHLVPDFCGMSMETANRMLEDMRDINSRRKQTKSSSVMTSSPKTAPGRVDGATEGMGRLRLSGAVQEGEADPFGRQPPPYAQPQATTTAPTPPPAQGPPGPGGYGYQQQQPQPPQQLAGIGAGRGRGGGPQQGYGYGHEQQGARPGASPPVPVQTQTKMGLPASPVQQLPPQQQQRPDRTSSLPPQGVGQYPGQGQGQGQYAQQQLSQYQQYSQQQGYQQPPALAPPAEQQQQQSAQGQGPGQQVQRLPARQVTQGQAPSQGQGYTPRRKVGLDDFNFLAVLGKGNFGKVMLAEEKKTNGLYAIKVLKKEFIIDNDEVESTRSEKRVFLAAAKERHPFLLGLHSCFQTETRVYFVMEYVSGGDLMLHIQRKQFSLRQAKFYASEVLLALEYFHAQGIIYRDLKLDNILLTLDGHVKVADYGLCKEEMWFSNTTSTFCGTPEFMAPEILLEQRYGRAVDWWAFGVLTYEMLLGQSPFRGDDEDEIFDAILEDEPLYPITMPRDAVSILQKLLTRDPNRRLGSTKEDAEEIKRQPFFKDVSWDDVMNKRIPPPYFPTINGSADTSNFDEEFTREQPTLTPVHGQLSSRDQAEFNGFSYVASWADI